MMTTILWWESSSKWILACAINVFSLSSRCSNNNDVFKWVRHLSVHMGALSVGLNITFFNAKSQSQKVVLLVLFNTVATGSTQCTCPHSINLTPSCRLTKLSWYFVIFEHHPHHLGESHASGCHTGALPDLATKAIKYVSMHVHPPLYHYHELWNYGVFASR